MGMVLIFENRVSCINRIKITRDIGRSSFLQNLEFKESSISRRLLKRVFCGRKYSIPPSHEDVLYAIHEFAFSLYQAFPWVSILIGLELKATLAFWMGD